MSKNIAVGIPTTKQSAYGYSEDRELSWSDIYVKIGRLREINDQLLELKEIDKLRGENNDLRMHIEQLTNTPK